ncbi:MAG TPA: hypothetical protein PLQ35_11720 [bacterium]|nr:hypothetical protein [bacterium]
MAVDVIPTRENQEGWIVKEYTKEGMDRRDFIGSDQGGDPSARDMGASPVAAGVLV